MSFNLQFYRVGVEFKSGGTFNRPFSISHTQRAQSKRAGKSPFFAKVCVKTGALETRYNTWVTHLSSNKVETTLCSRRP